MIDVKKIGPWRRVGKLLAAAPQRMQAAFDKALLQEAQFLRTKIVEGIREQAPGGRAFTPLAPTTLEIRRFRGFHGTKALVVQGDLHEESRPLRWGEMLEDQRRAFLHVHRLVNEIGKDFKKEEATRGGKARRNRVEEIVRIDQHRTNRAILIDSKRGAGKTSVLLSLVELWSRTAPKGLGDALHDKHGLDLNEETNQLAAKTIREALDLVAVIPTAIVDLQPLPENVHLMLHVTEHLHALMDLIAVSETPGRSGSRPLDASESEKKWEAFAQNAAKSWQRRSNRDSRLSPEDLALEVGDVERDRVHLAGSFRAFVDALQGEITARFDLPNRRELLFVVPIDDADLNPWRSGEILDIVRWLYHPRVAFVLAGDTTMFQRELRAEALGSLGSELRNLRFQEGLLDDLYNLSTINLLAIDNYDKVVPPSHRAKLLDLSPSNRMKVEGIETFLARIKFPEELTRKDPEVKTLKEYLKETRLEAALPAQLRALLHIPSLFEIECEQETLTKKALPDPETMTLATLLVQRALSRSGIIHHGERPMFVPEDEPHPADVEIENLLPHMTFEISTTRTHPWRTAGSDKSSRPRFSIVPDDAELIAWSARSAAAAPRSAGAAPAAKAPADGLDGQISRQRVPDPFPGQLCAAKMLYREMRSVSRNLGTDGLPEIPAVVCLVDTTPEPLTIRWPAPTMPRYLDIRTFITWVNNLRIKEDITEEVFVARYMNELCERRRPGGGKVDTLHNVASVAREAWIEEDHEFALKLIEMAAPEFGFSEQMSRRWLDIAYEVMGENWPNLRTKLLSRRKERFDLKVHSVAAIDKTFERHPWFVFVGSQEISTPADRLIGVLTDGSVRSLSDPIVLPPRYQQELRDLGTVPTAAILLAIDAARQATNGIELLIASVWAAVTAQDPRTYGDMTVALSDRGLSVTPPRDPWSELRSSDANVPVGDAHVSRIQSEIEAVERRFWNELMPSGVRVLHELAWDVAVNAGSATRPNQDRQFVPWYGVAIGTKEKRRLWPAPSYATFTETMLLVDAWNRALAATVESQSLTSMSPPYLLDGLAHAFLQAIVQITRYRSTQTVLVGRLPEHAWSDLAAARATNGAWTSNGCWQSSSIPPRRYRGRHGLPARDAGWPCLAPHVRPAMCSRTV